MHELFSLIFLKLLEGIPIWGVSAGIVQLSILFYLNKKKLLSFFTAIFLLLYILVIYPILFVGSGIGADSLAETKNFDLDEAMFWFLNLISINWIPSNRHLQLYLLAFFGYLFFWIFIKTLFNKYINKYFKFLEYIVIFAIISIPLSSKVNNVVISFSKMTNQYESYNRNFNYNLNNFEVSQKDNGLNVLLYIGESTSSMHMNIFDYPRENTPMLKKIKLNDQNFIIFKNVWSTHTHTSASLLRALSFNNSNIKNKQQAPLTIIEEKRISITDLLDKTNIKTFLYSNQGKSGSWNLASSIIFKNANKSFGNNNVIIGNTSDFQDKPFDHVYFKKFFDEQFVENKNQEKSLYVFHSYAGHGPYTKFIPDKYKKKIDNFYTKHKRESIFGESNFFIHNNLEDYDSAISYIDFSLHSSISQVKNHNKPIVLIYFSDHGESPFTSRGHDSSKFISEMARVPFFMYFNEKAKSLRPDLYDKFKNASSKDSISTLEQLPTTILDLLGIDVTSPKYFLDNFTSPIGFPTNKKQILLRQIGNKYSYVNLDYLKELNDDIYVNDTDDSTKNYVYNKRFGSEDLGICHHRSNSLARIIRGNFNSNCIEIDLVIKDQQILISHDISDYSDLNLNVIDKILSPKNKLWIDGKNLNESENCFLLLKFFKHRKSLSNRTMIEFPSNTTVNENLSHCINSFKILGVSTSFYVPTKVGIDCKNSKVNNELNLNSNECKNFKKIIREALDTNYFTDLSYDFQLQELISKLNYNNFFKLNTWNISHEDIKNLNLKYFRLIIPKLRDPNYR